MNLFSHYSWDGQQDTPRPLFPPAKACELEKGILILPINITKQILSISHSVPTLGTAFPSVVLLRPVLGIPSIHPLLSISAKGLENGHLKPPGLAMSMSSDPPSLFLGWCLLPMVTTDHIHP